MEENVLNNSLKDKVNSLGADTIMGAMAAHDTEEQKKNLEKLSEAVEQSNEEKETKNAAITGDTIEALKRMGYIPKTRPIARDYKKIGRNDPCPCGSGKKYKDCCLSSGKYETTHFE